MGIDVGSHVEAEARPVGEKCEGEGQLTEGIVQMTGGVQ